MKKLMQYTFIALLLLSGSCGEKMSEEEMAIRTERELKDAEAAIEEANKLIPLLISEGKYEEAGKFFAPEVVQIISGQEPIRGRKAWIQAQKDAAELGDWMLEIETLDFQFLGDHVVERGRGVQTFTANEDSPIPSMQMTGDYLVFWTKTDEGWQILYDYVVINPPAMPGE